MSFFFFRFHNLQKDATKRKSLEIHQNGKVFHNFQNEHLSAVPSRLFEKTNYARDSLDEIAIAIPR
jgi:hypothetical protein